MSTDVTFFETIPFSLSSPITSQGEDDDLLMYTIASPTLTPAPIPVKLPITQVYSQRQNPPNSSLTSDVLSSNPVQNDDLLIALRTGKHQCAHPISSFVSYNHLSPSSYSFIASLDLISFPHTVHETLSHPCCYSAMVEEMQALDDNGTWNLVHCGEESHWMLLSVKTKLYDVINVCQTSGTATQELFSSRQRHQKLVHQIYIYTNL